LVEKWNHKRSILKYTNIVESLVHARKVLGINYYIDASTKNIIFRSIRWLRVK
jgi:hypothetical protein